MFSVPVWPDVVTWGHVVVPPKEIWVENVWTFHTTSVVYSHLVKDGALTGDLASVLSATAELGPVHSYKRAIVLRRTFMTETYYYIFQSAKKFHQSMFAALSTSCDR